MFQKVFFVILINQFIKQEKKKADRTVHVIVSGLS
jgi:hypothetical protein